MHQIGNATYSNADALASIIGAQNITVQMLSILAGNSSQLKRMTCASSGTAESCCPAPYTHRRTSSCYFVQNSSTAWINASATCQQFGGHLVTVDDAGENAFVAVLGPRNGRSFWIGIYRDPSTGSWILAENGSNATFFQWLEKEPNGGAREPCAEMRRNDAQNGTWNDESCSTQFEFVCERAIL